MARVMIIGYGPLPRRDALVVSSRNLRTLQIVEGARLGGHEISLYTLPLRGSQAGDERAELVPDEIEGINAWRFTSHSGEFAVERLGEEIESARPEAIIGVNTYPSYIASMLSTPLPLWCDLNGCWMAEMQAKCWADGEDAALAGAWNIERAILRRLDRFSAVSRPHLHGALGELAAVGRMNRHTFNYPFGSRIPHAAFRHDAPGAGAGELRGKIVPEDAFILLWMGGFHPSCDVDMLLHATSELMARHANLHLVATGGPAPGGDERTWLGFKVAVEAARDKDRIHLLGWIESERLAPIMREADLGLNVDGRNYETMFGARTRLAVMAAAGLPAVSTLGTEQSELLDDAGAVIPAQMGEPQTLIDAIEPWIGKREKLKEIGRRAKAFAESEMSIEATTGPLRKWLEAPRNAPDNFVKLQKAGKDFTSFHAVALSPLEEEWIAKEGGEGASQGADGGEPQGIWSRMSKGLFGEARKGK